MKNDKSDRLKRWCFATCAALFILLYGYGALEHSKRINLDVDRVDQAAYLSYARNLYETNYNYVGGRNRMPVYPFLLSLIYSPDFTQNQFFTRSKFFNIALSAATLPSLFWLFQSSLPLLQAVNLWLITTFTVFIFRASYVQAELLFYSLNFCSFLLMWNMLKQPSWQLGILTGIVLGITHLTKASIAPGLLLFVIFYMAQQAYGLWNSCRQQPSQNQQIRRKITSSLFSLALVILVFLSILSPYISTSQRFFGQYFYNVNSTFYIWYDNWEQTKTGTGAYGDNKGWPEMPPETVPSLSKYLQEHTAAQIIERLIKGFDRIYTVVAESYGYFKYFLVYLAFAAFTSICFIRSSLAIAKSHIFQLGFISSYFIFYLILYAWYAPIADGNRFILAQFLPFMFFTASILKIHFFQHPFINIWRIKLQWFYIFGWIILGMILFEIYPILTSRIITMFAGT
jgi:hypothetical protein